MITNPVDNQEDLNQYHSHLINEILDFLHLLVNNKLFQKDKIILRYKVKLMSKYPLISEQENHLQINQSVYLVNNNNNNKIILWKIKVILKIVKMKITLHLLKTILVVILHCK